MSKKVSMEDIVSLCKRRGFIFPGSDVYGGLSGTWDYGPLGVELKNNLQDNWWRTFVRNRDDMVGVDAAILMNPNVWQASGHVDTFSDPLVECTNCKSRFRADHVDLAKCENCGEKEPFGPAREFNMMFRTKIGPVSDRAVLKIPKELIQQWHNLDSDVEHMLDSSQENKTGEDTVYLRPETAQGIFTNFKNVVDTLYPDVPFGIAQIGKAFRNEISPRDFVFRSREFGQMEIEYFVHPTEWEQSFEQWRADIKSFLSSVGVDSDKVHELEVPTDDLAHYSKRTIDYEFEFPHGRDELLGLAYRTDFDLKNIERGSSKKMEYRPKDGSEPFVPHVIEPSFGLERLVMAVLLSAYSEDEQNGEKRVFLKLPEHIAPYKFCVSPLLKNKPELVAEARKIYEQLKTKYSVTWDDNGNIGKRYRRQDEIGTPYCVVIDFQTLEDGTVTIRDRDTTEQKRVSSID